MSISEFRTYGKHMVDYIADYLENIHKKRVVPAIDPGYMRELLPHSAPFYPEQYQTVMEDFEKYIMPGVGVTLQ